jgi:hypothetical protein
MKVKPMRIPEDIDLLAEAGVKGNIRASDVFASFNSISPNIFEKCLYNQCSSVLICVP